MYSRFDVELFETKISDIGSGATFHTEDEKQQWRTRHREGG